MAIHPDCGGDCTFFGVGQKASFACMPSGPIRRASIEVATVSQGSPLTVNLAGGLRDFVNDVGRARQFIQQHLRVVIGHQIVLRIQFDRAR